MLKPRRGETSHGWWPTRRRRDVMKANKLLGIGMFVMAGIVISGAGVESQQRGWPPPMPGCHYTGSSACGGTDRGQCAPHQRFLSQQCEDNGQVINACAADTSCESTNKGRANLTGAWSGGYSFAQSGDSLNVTGGQAGPGSGRFIGPYQIQITWPQTHVTLIAQVNVPKANTPANINNRADRLNWNNNTVWTR